ncbi:MAG: tryptophan--tRNA ligase, partial [Candidatus Omnitrophica bacterium]|nr:tryptophan--tRNA ligase [Candidatus Omnitrophota bacterium]
DAGHPDTCNVFAYYSTFVPAMKAKVRDWCLHAKLGCTDCKKELALNIIEKLRPLQQRREDLLKDKNKIKKILQEGNEKAGAVASKTLKEVREAMQL